MSKKLPTNKTDYPTGVCVKTETGYWYINGKYKNKIKNARVFKSWSFPLVIETTDSAIAHMPRAKALGFRAGTLVRDISDGKVYLISENTRRMLGSPESYDILGLKRRDAIWAAHDEIILHPEGEAL